MGKRQKTLLTFVTVLACICACALVVTLPTAPASEPTPLADTQVELREDAAVPDSNTDSNDAIIPDSAASATSGDDPSIYEPGIALVTMAPGTTSEQALAAIAATPALEGTVIEEQIGDDLLKLALPSETTVNQALDALTALPQVEAAQPNFRYYTQEGATAQMGSSTAPLAIATVQSTVLATEALTVNDPYYTGNRQWALASINAPDAWETVAATASQQVTVAVMDEGFLTYHEDLTNVITNPYDAVTSKSSTLAAYNQGHSEHGTHVAGIIAAQANNAKGIAGVAYNTSSFSTCKLMPIKVADSKGGITTASLIKGYNYLLSTSGGTTVAKKLNVRVINLSLGTSREDEYDTPDRELQSVITKAWNSGIVTVAAACNIEDTQYNTAFRAYPCDFPNVVGVISLTRANNSDGVARDQTSNFNKYARNTLSRALSGNESKDISAPGASIYSTYTDDSDDPANNQYRSLSGTSMATPVVSGVLALMFQANPSLTASQATNTLYSTARDLTASSGTSTGWDRATGYGEADAAAAVAAVAPRISGPTEIAYDSTGSFSVYVGSTRQTASSYTWTSSNEKVAKVKQISSTACVIEPVGSGTATIKATNGTLTATQKVTVKWPSVIGPSVVVPGNTFTCGISIDDATQPATSWKWTSNAPAVVSITSTGSATARASGTATLTASNAAGTFSIAKVVTVSTDLDVGPLDITVPSVTYTGAALKPKPTVSNGSIPLTAGTDYAIVGYANNVNAGTAKITIEGRGSYKGTTTRTFTVKRASISKATITLSATSLTYNGKTRKPTVKSVTATVGGATRKLAKGIDYTLTNSGVKTGTGKVAATGKGNFTGTATAKYTVKVVKKPVYQMYNGNTGQWFYTTNSSDITSKVQKGWTYKGVAFRTPSKSTKPVYRFYNPTTKRYRYSTKASLGSSWTRQKIAFYSYSVKTKPVYAYYSSTTHAWRYSTATSLSDYTRKGILGYAV